MNKTHQSFAEIKLVGISNRTNNLIEMDNQKAQIPKTLHDYFSNNLADTIESRKNPGVTYCVYAEYESDENGPYTYFVGEEVESFKDVSSELKTLTIPAQNYVKFNVGPGQMPNICIEAWQKIWQMSIDNFGGEREYIADFEIYDERSIDPTNAIFDLYVGIKKNN